VLCFGIRQMCSRAHMGRRDFIILLGGALSASLHARRSRKARRLVVLMTGRVNAQMRMETIQRGLQSRGWTEGRNISIEYRWAVGDAAQAHEFAKELVGRQPAVAIVQSERDEGSEIFPSGTL